MMRGREIRISFAVALLALLAVNAVFSEPDAPHSLASSPPSPNELADDLRGAARSVSAQAISELALCSQVDSVPVVFVKNPSELTVRVVTALGHPVGGHEVSLIDSSGVREAVRRCTEPNGVVRFSDLEPGCFSVEEESGAKRIIRFPHDGEIDFVLASGKFVITVRDPEGQLVPGASIVRHDVKARRSRVLGTTNADGVASVWSARGILQATKPGFGGSLGVFVHRIDENEAFELSLSTSSAALSVTAVDAAGHPAEGLVEIRPLDVSGGASERQIGGCERFVRSGLPIRFRLDQDGAGRCDELGAGRYAVRWRRPGMPTMERHVELKRNDHLAVDFVAEAGFDLDVLVLDPFGKPLPGARITTPSLPGTRIFTNDDGRSRLGSFRAGAHEIHVHHSSFGGRVATIDDADAASGCVTVELVADSFLNVRVLSEVDGTPLEGCRVRCLCNTREVARGLSDEEGFVKLAAPAGEAVRVSVSRPGVYGPVAGEVEVVPARGEQGVELRVDPQRFVTVDIQGRCFGTGGEVEAWDVADGTLRSLRSARFDESGRFVMAGVPVGDWAVVVRRSDGILVSGRRVTIDGGATAVTLDAEAPTGQIHFTSCCPGDSIAVSLMGRNLQGDVLSGDTWISGELGYGEYDIVHSHREGGHSEYRVRLSSEREVVHAKR